MLFNDVLRRRNWTPAESELLVSILDEGFPPDALRKGIGTGEEVGKGLVYSQVFDVIKIRFNSAAPVDRDARRSIVRRILRELESGDEYKRSVATMCLLGIEPLIMLPYVRQRVEETALTLDKEDQHFVRHRLDMLDEVMAKHPLPPDVQRKLDEMDQIVRSLGE